MNEETYMNQKVIEVEVELLSRGEDADLLRFGFEENPLEVNLNSPSCQSELKAIFVRLLQMLIENEVNLVLHPATDYGRTMYIEVCEEYIKDLNRELASAKDKISVELR